MPAVLGSTFLIHLSSPHTLVDFAIGFVPLAFVATLVKPIVTSTWIHLPTRARLDKQILMRWIKTVPLREIKMELVTISFTGKPRVTYCSLAELRPVGVNVLSSNGLTPRKAKGGFWYTKFGLVNWERDITEAQKKRKWWYFKPIGKFGIHWRYTVRNFPDVWKELKHRAGVFDEDRKKKDAKTRQHYGEGII